MPEDQQQQPRLPGPEQPEHRGVLTDVVVPATTAAANIATTALAIKALKQPPK